MVKNTSHRSRKCSTRMLSGRPPHPNPKTVKTTWSAPKRCSTRGCTHSSSTIRTGLSGGERFHQTLLGQGKKAGRLLALHARKIGEEGIEGVTFGDVVEKGLNRHTRAGKARGAVQKVRIHLDDFIEIQFLHDAHMLNKDKAKWQLPASIMAGQCAGHPGSIPWMH